jgi:hypothetical protein
VPRRRFAQITAIAALVVAAYVYRAVTRDPGRTRDAEATVVAPIVPRLVIAPGDDASVLPLGVDGARLIEIDRSGALLVHNGPVVRRQPQPRAYQEIDGLRRDVPVRFDIAAGGDVRLKVGPYDRTVPLVIEPQPGKTDLQD